MQGAEHLRTKREEEVFFLNTLKISPPQPMSQKGGLRSSVVHALRQPRQSQKQARNVSAASGSKESPVAKSNVVAKDTKVGGARRGALQGALQKAKMDARVVALSHAKSSAGLSPEATPDNWRVQWKSARHHDSALYQPKQVASALPIAFLALTDMDSPLIGAFDLMSRGAMVDGLPVR